MRGRRNVACVFALPAPVADRLRDLSTLTGLPQAAIARDILTIDALTEWAHTRAAALGPSSGLLSATASDEEIAASSAEDAREAAE